MRAVAVAALTAALLAAGAFVPGEAAAMPIVSGDGLLQFDNIQLTQRSGGIRGGSLRAIALQSGVQIVLRTRDRRGGRATVEYDIEVVGTIISTSLFAAIRGGNGSANSVIQDSVGTVQAALVARDRVNRNFPPIARQIVQTGETSYHVVEVIRLRAGARRVRTFQNFGVASVPEPGTAGLLLLGAGAVAWQVRRRSAA